MGNMGIRNVMPLTIYQVVEIFDVRGIKFMRPSGILLASSTFLWVSITSLNGSKQSQHEHVMRKMSKKNILRRFGFPKAIISNGGLHFCNRFMDAPKKKCGIDRKVASVYHPQTSGNE